MSLRKFDSIERCLPIRDSFLTASQLLLQRVACITFVSLPLKDILKKVPSLSEARTKVKESTVPLSEEIVSQLRLCANELERASAAGEDPIELLMLGVIRTLCSGVEAGQATFSHPSVAQLLADGIGMFMNAERLYADQDWDGCIALSIHAESISGAGYTKRKLDHGDTDSPVLKLKKKLDMKMGQKKKDRDWEAAGLNSEVISAVPFLLVRRAMAFMQKLIETGDDVFRFKATEAWEAALHLTANNPSDQALTLVCRASLIGHPEQATAVFKQASALEDRVHPHYIWLAALSQNHPRALPEVERALVEEPRCAPLLALKSSFLVASGKGKKAVASAEKLCEISEAAASIGRRAFARACAGSNDDAIEDCKKCIQLLADEKEFFGEEKTMRDVTGVFNEIQASSRIYAMLATLLIRQGDSKGALAALERCIESDEMQLNFGAWKYRAELIAEERPAEAARDLLNYAQRLAVTQNPSKKMKQSLRDVLEQSAVLASTGANWELLAEIAVVGTKQCRKHKQQLARMHFWAAVAAERTSNFTHGVNSATLALNVFKWAEDDPEKNVIKALLKRCEIAEEKAELEKVQVTNTPKKDNLKPRGRSATTGSRKGSRKGGRKRAGSRASKRKSTKPKAAVAASSLTSSSDDQGDLIQKLQEEREDLKAQLEQLERANSAPAQDSGEIEALRTENDKLNKQVDKLKAQLFDLMQLNSEMTEKLSVYESKKEVSVDSLLGGPNQGKSVPKKAKKAKKGTNEAEQPELPALGEENVAVVSEEAQEETSMAPKPSVEVVSLKMAEDEEEKTKAATSSKQGSKIAGLSASLKFNPMMMMGGGLPVAKKKPVDTSKVPEDRLTEDGRLKVARRPARAGGRRPPSRRRRPAVQPESEEEHQPEEPREKKKCKDCGAIPIEDDSIFCEDCGTKF